MCCLHRIQTFAQLYFMYVCVVHPLCVVLTFSTQGMNRYWTVKRKFSFNNAALSMTYVRLYHAQNGGLWVANISLECSTQQLMFFSALVIFYSKCSISLPSSLASVAIIVVNGSISVSCLIHCCCFMSCYPLSRSPWAIQHLTSVDSYYPTTIGGTCSSRSYKGLDVLANIDTIYMFSA